jgi:hypothetical protein
LKGSGDTLSTGVMGENKIIHGINEKEKEK